MAPRGRRINMYIYIYIHTRVDPQKVKKKNSVGQVDLQKVEKNNVEQVGSYTFLYLNTSTCLQIARNSFMYLIHPHIHQNIEYWENDGQHKTQKWS